MPGALASIGWGDRNNQYSSYKNPTVRVYTGTNPAANTECSDTVPAGKLWLLQSYVVSCAQGITQTPLPSLTISDGTNTLFTYPGLSSAMDVSVTCVLTWAPYELLSAGGAATSSTAPIPGWLYLPPGFIIATSTAGKGANTNFGAPIITVLEYS